MPVERNAAMKKIITAIFSVVLTVTLHAQETIMLYENGTIPNSKPSEKQEKSAVAGNGRLLTSDVTTPSLLVFLPPAEKANGTAVIICPGGGYRYLAADHEGTAVAKVLNEWGVAAFVLKYRLPSDDIMQDKTIGPLQDAQRAIQVVREKARLWQINPKQIGIMGFSAGGHLAGSATVHFDQALIPNPLKISLRPDFSILAYPVITFTDPFAHKGSREQLLGKEPAPDKLKFYSLELHVTKKTPPVFLMHARDDKAVRVENSQLFADALEKNKVKYDMYLYEKGGHGFGLINPTTDVDWMKYLKQWMFNQDLILKRP
jgi:acetyl esterase/lipase